MMKFKSKLVTLTACGAFVGAFALGALAQGSWKLNINGRVVSTNAKTIGGQLYVPAADVAKALGMKMSKTGTTIAFKPLGGAMQAGKLVGNMGEDLFSGKYGFKVVSVERTKKYALRYPSRYQRAETFDAPEGQEFVIINSRLKNGTPQKDEFAFSTGDWSYNTSLTDMDEQSYQPYKYDVLADEGAPLGRYVLPAASLNFALVFAVPEGTQIKDVVYSVLRYGDRSDKKFTDFRVSVKGK